MQWTGHIQALMTVPAGGAAVSASNGAHNAAIVTTVPADDYWLNSTYNQASLLSTFQQYLNDNVQGYPTTAAAMQAAVGYGTWSSGWLLNITSGNDVGAFGGVTLTAGGAPGYVSGPRGGVDKAVQVTNAAAYFTGGTGFDVNATSDLAIAWVAKLDSAATAARLVQKNSGGTGYWIVDFSATQVLVQVNDGVDTATAQAAVGSAFAGQWHVGIAVLDRSTNRLRIATAALDVATSFVSAETDSSAVGSTGAGATFYVGNTHAGPTQIAALYIGTGTGAATGLSANLTTAIANFKNAVNAAWSVSLGSDGRVTIANSHLPSSVAFTNTMLRNAVGFEYDFDYPQTAAQMATAVGYATWTSAYLCNEAAGSLVDAFGAASSLAAVSSPTYNHAGARGGGDRAIGIDSNADAFGAAGIFNVDASTSIALLWVGYHSSTPTGTIISKYDGGTVRGYYVVFSGGNLLFQLADGAGSPQALAAGIPVNEWYVGIAVLDRSTGRIRIGYRTLRTNTTVVSSEIVAAAIDLSNSVSFFVGAGTWLTGTTDSKFSAVYVAHGSTSGLSANLSTALANFASYMKSQTGTKQARGIWYPDCPLFVAESDPRLAPVGSDARTAVSGTGDRITHVGVYHRFHRTLRYSHVPIDRIREQSATYANASFRTFWDDTQLARGPISWFRAGSSLLITDYNGNVLGQDMQSGGPAEGWGVTDPRVVEPKRVDPNGSDQRWLIEIPELIAKDE